MGKGSSIEWTDSTWNPWIGCLKISPGCKQCYMYRDQKRYGNDPADVHRTKPNTFNAPLRWEPGEKVFTCSWSDFFIKEADQWRNDAWGIIRRTPHLTYQILTKRPERISECLPTDWGAGWPHVWLGVSIETDQYLWRLRELYKVAAAVRWVSYEPALAGINWLPSLADGLIDWLVSGGESGTDPRSADTNWFRIARDQCNIFDVPFFHKQHGGSRRVDGVWGGRLLDGQEWNEFPEVE